MPVTHPTDSNGITYNAITTSAWYGSEGEALRAQGWEYCGFGAWGIYIRPPGGECYTRSAPVGPGPFIGPTVPQDQPATPTPGQPPTVTDSCASCKPSTATPLTPAPSAPTTPTAPGAPAPQQKEKQFPWWLILVLAILAVSHGRDDRK